MTAGTMILGNAGVLGPGRYRWARALLWLCLLAVISIAAFNLTADATLWLSAAFNGESFVSRASAPAAARLLAVLVGSAGMLGAYALAVRLGERRSAPELNLRALLPDLSVGLVIGIGLIAVIIALMWSAGWVTIVQSPVAKIAEPLKQAVQSGVIEEVLVRIIVFRLLWRAAGVWPALVLTALLFGGLHLSNPDATLFSGLCLVAGEGIGAGLYLLTGRVWMPVGMHVGWNFALGWIFGGAVSGVDDFAGGPMVTRAAEGVSTLLSGGGFGPESSAAGLIVALLASALCLTLAWRKGRFSASDG